MLHNYHITPLEGEAPFWRARLPFGGRGSLLEGEAPFWRARLPPSRCLSLRGFMTNLNAPARQEPRPPTMSKPVTGFLVLIQFREPRPPTGNPMGKASVPLANLLKILTHMSRLQIFIQLSHKRDTCSTHRIYNWRVI